MDTREKIIAVQNLPELLSSNEWIVAPETFDPLTTVQAVRIAKLRQPGAQLLAVILPSAEPLLSAEARACLVAALRDVDYVAVAQDASWRALIPRSSTVKIVEDPEGSRIRTSKFIRFILDRQFAGPTRV